MSKIATLRKGVNVVLTETESRIQGVLDASERAVSTFVFTVFATATTAVNAIVDIVFNLAETVVEEAFSVAESVVTAALGEVSFDEEDDVINEPGVEYTGDVFLPNKDTTEFDNDTPSTTKEEN